jgi:peptide/nickel transport system ATP-binding protein
MQRIRGDQISMIFQEPNAALNPILSIGYQISESFLFHQKPEITENVVEEMQQDSLNLWQKYQLMMLERSMQNPELFKSESLIKLFFGRRKFLFKLLKDVKKPTDIPLKILSKLPILRRWESPVYQEALKRSIEIVAKLGIANAEQVVTRYPHEVSGGMKQRIVIAIALACNPVLLIADEPTSNLDVTIQAQILELVKELKEKYISSVLFITHDLGVVAETCDRVGVMYAGNLCEVADAKELFRNPKHPYTSALLNAVPKVEQEGALASIEGAVPNLVEPPPGCRFHPRCPKVMDICRTGFPATKEISDNHFVACYLYT